MITIFTPTYNRAHTLPRLYKSLVAQNRPDFFEWLIVDDGSSDGTAELVKKFQDEQKISIRYYFQENAGKHIAINTALKLAKGEWFFTVDSDDYLRENALSTVQKIVEIIEKDTEGFTVIRFSDQIPFNLEDFGKKMWYEGDYEWPFHGEMIFCWRTDGAKKYPFPVFEGEKFCQESLVLRRMLAKHKVLWTDYVLLAGDYLEEGLTANLWKNMLKSPRYSMLNLSERMSAPNVTDVQKNSFAENYWDIARHAKIPFSEARKGMPWKYSARYFLQKLTEKISR